MNGVPPTPGEGAAAGPRIVLRNLAARLSAPTRHDPCARNASERSTMRIGTMGLDDWMVDGIERAFRPAAGSCQTTESDAE